jgi:predicted naringenin-chalcone synthase
MLPAHRPEPILGDFSMQRPAHRIDQREALEWIAEVHAASETTSLGLNADQRHSFEERTRRIVNRCACGPKQIGSRALALADVGQHDFDTPSVYDVDHHPRGRGTESRSRLYASIVSEYFETEYADVKRPPTDLIHVTCTGYVSPSGAQELVAKRGWGSQTRVTHAYHMGCYAAFPATRLAAGALLSRRAEMTNDESPRVDIVHTELCSLHLDPSDHTMEQFVVQSLFADGLIRYSLRERDEAPGLRLVAQREAIIPDSAGCMTWITTDAGMKMTLARDVPERIAGSLRAFVDELYRDAGRDPSSEKTRTVFGVHPGGPRIIDRVRDVLELDESQLRASRDVLFERGNMSSATLPHVWMRILEDDAVTPGTPVVSLAFGPGLTVCGALFEKQ